MTPTAVPRAKSAEMIGKMAAKIEPKIKQQHDEGEQHTQARTAERLVVCVLGQQAGHRHGQSVSGRVRHRIDELLRLRIRNLVRDLVEIDLEEANGFVRIDIGCVDQIARRVVRTGHARDVGQRLDLVDHGVDALTHRRVREARAVRRAEDDLLLVSGEARRDRLQEVDGIGGLRVREVEVVRVRRARGTHGEDAQHQGGGPEQEDEAAMSDTPPGEGAH